MRTRNKVAAEIAATGGQAIAIVADVTRPTDIDLMVARTTSAFGRLDFLHNNAFGLPVAQTSTQVAARTADVDDDVWHHMLDVGLTAVFRAMKRAIPVMRTHGGGAIVNTASISGVRATASRPTTPRRQA